MSDFIIVDGDQAMFIPAFGMATVVVQPGEIAGSGPSTIGGTPACIDGDEASVEVPGCNYITAVHTVPGSGTLKIDALAGDQLAQKTTVDGTPVILKGSMFTAVFEVQSPAQQPTPTGPVPDASPKYSGNGNFMNSNVKCKGT
ncbi:MAG: hypothetical protein COA42_04935 [Alteromonadaceae bacterium]|nr:MAG: hypothetical protein COA42_04935 [Alteromonadaceae bacterium]